MYHNNDNSKLYLHLLDCLLKYIYKNKKMLEKYLVYPSIKDDINRLSKIIYNIVYYNYAGQEYINDLYINITDSYFVLNYCVDAWFDDENDVDPYVSFEECIIAKDFSSIYFMSSMFNVRSYKYNEIDNSVNYKINNAENFDWKLTRNLDSYGVPKIKQVTEEIDEYLLSKY